MIMYRTVGACLLLWLCGVDLYGESPPTPISVKIYQGGTLKYPRVAGTFTEIGDRRLIRIQGIGRLLVPLGSDLSQNDLLLTLRAPAGNNGTLGVGERALEGFAFLMGDHVLKVWRISGGEVRVATDGDDRLFLTGRLQLHCSYFRGRSSDSLSDPGNEEVDLSNLLIRKDSKTAGDMFEPVLIRFAPTLAEWKKDIDDYGSQK